MNPVDPSKLKVGDLVVVATRRDAWGDALRYEGFDEERGMLLVRELAGEQRLFRAHPAAVSVPRVLGLPGGDADAPPVDSKVSGTTRRATKSRRTADRPGGSITPAQRRKLFALASRRGLDLDGLRDLTPAGSVSMLTRSQAADLIDRLEGRQPAQRVYDDQGGASGGQLGKIAALAAQVGFTPAELAEWMGKRFGVASVDQIADGDLAHKIVGGLSRMLANRQRRASGTG